MTLTYKNTTTRDDRVMSGKEFVAVFVTEKASTAVAGSLNSAFAPAAKSNTTIRGEAGTGLVYWNTAQMITNLTRYTDPVSIAALNSGLEAVRTRIKESKIKQEQQEPLKQRTVMTT
jgi:hypothetical protein